MAWRNVEEGTELSIRIEAERSSSLRMESTPSRRLRLSLEGEGRLWARVERHWAGVWILRSPSTTALNLIEPIRAVDARRTPPSTWTRWFAEALGRSNRSPLGRGEWRLTELVARPPSLSDLARKQTPDVFFSSNEDGLPSPAYGANAAADLSRIHYTDWGINGSGDVIPLRDFSPLDAARVKSWRKHAREGTLPPILLWWVSALDVYVILDGHDRLRASIAEGVPPKLVALWQRQVSHDVVAPSARDEFTAKYERAFETGRLSVGSRDQFNRQLGYYYRPWWPRAVTSAKANRGLDARWEEEVRELGAGEEHLDELLRLDERGPRQRSE